jgi:hypothetical protein
MMMAAKKRLWFDFTEIAQKRSDVMIVLQIEIPVKFWQPAIPGAF